MNKVLKHSFNLFANDSKLPRFKWDWLISNLTYENKSQLTHAKSLFLFLINRPNVTAAKSTPNTLDSFATFSLPELVMQSVRLLRLCIQAVALTIFAYQMIVALEKYATFSSVPTEKTKDITDAKLPDIYFCMEIQSKSPVLKNHGYLYRMNRMTVFFWGILEVELGRNSFVTWEGINNQSYEKILGKNVRMFNKIIYTYKYNAIKV